MRIFLSIILLFGLQQTQAQSFQQKLNNWLKDSSLTSASVGFKAVNVSTGSVLAEHNSNLALVPASCQKLVTTSAALHLLGENQKFTTLLKSNGIIQNGILEGNLIVEGGGDPSFGSKYNGGAENVLNQFVNAVKAQGITKITGNVVCLESNFEPYNIPRTWIWEDMGNYYGSGTSGLTWRDNTVTIFFKSPEEPNKPTEIVKTIPKVPNLTFQNQVLSSNSNRDNAYLFGAPYQFNRLAQGNIPKARDNFKVKGSLPDPAQQFAFELYHALNAAGIQVLGSFSTAVEPGLVSNVFFQYQGLSVAEIVKYTNQKSVNLFAEHLLLQLGGKNQEECTRKNGLKVIEQFLKDQKVTNQGVNLVDGSGMSRFNTLTTQSLTQLLLVMNKSKHKSAFRNSLAVSGKSGTFKRFMDDANSIGKVAGKSGYMERVRSYTGYLKIESGEVAFSIMVNNYSCSASEMKVKIEKLLEELIQE